MKCVWWAEVTNFMKHEEGFGVILVIFLVTMAMAGMAMSILIIYDVERENEKLLGKTF